MAVPAQFGRNGDYPTAGRTVDIGQRVCGNARAVAELVSRSPGRGNAHRLDAHRGLQHWRTQGARSLAGRGD